jgi:HlyD family secretion protein
LTRHVHAQPRRSVATGDSAGVSIPHADDTATRDLAGRRGARAALRYRKLGFVVGALGSPPRATFAPVYVQSRMRKPPRWVVVVLVLVVVGVAVRLFLLRPAVIVVEVTPVVSGVVEETVTNTRAGTVKARNRAKLSPQLGGRVIAVPHREGARVAAGELLLKLDDSVQQAQLRLAREDVRTATARAEEACLAAELTEKDLVRGSALKADGITSEQMLDTLESNRDRAQAGCRAARAVLDQAQSNVRLVEVELALTEIRAPFGGVLAEVGTEVGEWITPSPPALPVPAVLDLIDSASLYISAPIDEVDAERVKPGLELRMTVDSRPGEHLRGRLLRVAPYVVDVLEQNRTVEIEGELVDGGAGILPGTSADVEVILERRDGVLRIPTSAIAEGGKVLVLTEGRLHERVVKAGMRNWQFTEVTSGLEANEQVVVARDSVEVKAGARARAKGQS